MITTDQQRVAEALDRTRRAYPHSRVTDDQLNEYVDDLDDLPAEAVVQAITECRRTGEFFPTLAAIRTRAVEVVGGEFFVDPEVAWGEVRRNAERFGVSGTRVTWAPDGEHAVEVRMEWSSPLIAEAVESIGWRDICLVDDKQLNTIRAQFRDSLSAIQRRKKDAVVSGRTGLDTAALPDGSPGRKLHSAVAALADGMRMDRPAPARAAPVRLRDRVADPPLRRTS